MRKVFFAVLFLLWPVVLAAQTDLSAKPVPVFGLKNLSVEEIIKRFGPPDQKRASPNGRESWVYGKSIIFFSEGKVTAWSDAGEFAERKNLAQIQAPPEKDEKDLSQVWINPWTPNSMEHAQDEVLQDITTNP
jgi:hypothetical protein